MSIPERLAVVEQRQAETGESLRVFIAATTEHRERTVRELAEIKGLAQRTADVLDKHVADENGVIQQVSPDHIAGAFFDRLLGAGRTAEEERNVMDSLRFGAGVAGKFKRVLVTVGALSFCAIIMLGAVMATHFKLIFDVIDVIKN